MEKNQIHFIFREFVSAVKNACYIYRIDVGLFGGKAGLILPFKPYGVRGVRGNAGVSGRGDPANDVSGSVSDRYDENDSSRA